MATTNIQQARIPTAFDIPVFNYAVTDIPAWTALSLDAANTMANATSSPTGIGVLISPTGGSPAVCIGFSIELIPAGQSGRMAGPGQVALGICDGAVTAGTVVDASASTAGRIKTHTAAKNQAGIALATGADADLIPVLVALAADA